MLFCTRVKYAQLIFAHLLQPTTRPGMQAMASPERIVWLRTATLSLCSVEMLILMNTSRQPASYLTNLCVPVATNTSRRYLRSATHGDLQVPSTRTVTYGPRSFAVSGPTVWNTLPSILRVSTTTLGQFQSGLKTILFRLAYVT